METFGDIIRRLRIAKKLTIREVAAYLEIDPSVLTKIEKGQRQANRELVVKLAKYLGYDEKELLTAWLSDKLVEYSIGEEIALQAFKAAEEKILCKTEKKLNINDIKKIFRRIFKEEPKILKAYLFGSFARGEADYKSDIDIMIAYDKTKPFSFFDFVEIQHRGEALTGRKIDLVTEGHIKPFAQASVEKDLTLIYEKKI